MSHRIHFLFDEKKAEAANYAAGLINDLGQSGLEESEAVVSIGGDGLLLEAFRIAHGRKVCGLVPMGSNSRGFWTNKGVASAKELKDVLESAPSYAVKPLRAEITFADGSVTERYAYNDISIRSVDKEVPDDIREKFELSDIDASVQSSLLNLKVAFEHAVIGPYRIMGTGIIFSTSFGSTAMNRNYGGPSVDIRQDAIVLTGMGTAEPVKGFNPIVNAGDTSFEIAVGSPDKRPVMMTFDSFAIRRNEHNSPIAKITISAAPQKTVRLVLKDDPGIRAFSAMIPQQP